MSTTQKRPRIPAELAERVYRARGTDTFEAFVRTAVDTYVGRFWIEMEPGKRNRYRVFTDDAEVVAKNLTKRDAEDTVYLLAHASAVTNHLSHLSEAVSARGIPLYDEFERMLNEMDDIAEAIAARSYKEA